MQYHIFLIFRKYKLSLLHDVPFKIFFPNHLIHTDMFEFLLLSRSNKYNIDLLHFYPIMTGFLSNKVGACNRK